MLQNAEHIIAIIMAVLAGVSFIAHVLIKLNQVTTLHEKFCSLENKCESFLVWKAEHTMAHKYLNGKDALKDNQGD